MPRATSFHGSFCGSTLLTRLLEACTTALVVREPQCLVDISDARSARGRLTPCDDDLVSICDFAATSLTALSEPGKPVVIKPSNWANNLVPALCSAAGARPLFITMERRAFLRAVFRGGRERLVFTARVAAHLAATFPNGRALVSAAIAARDPLQQIARLAALAPLAAGKHIRFGNVGGCMGQPALLGFCDDRNPARSGSCAGSKGAWLNAGER